MEENIFAGISKEEIRLPLDILGGYANQFNTAFGKSLVFEVSKTLESSEDIWTKVELFEEIKEPAEKKFVVRAYVMVPNLGNYKMLVLKLSYLRSRVYPCELYNALTDKKLECKTPDALDTELKKIFVSEEFKKPIRILLSQIG